MKNIMHFWKKKNDIELRVYNIDNLIIFFINIGIKILEKYDSFLQRINESKE